VLYRLEEPCVPKVFPLMATQGWVIC